MTNGKLPTSAKAQRELLLKALKVVASEGITSHRANTELGIYHPPARIKELRQLGFEILTLWSTIETHLSQPRRVARYVLIAEANGGVQ